MDDLSLNVYVIRNCNLLLLVTFSIIKKKFGFVSKTNLYLKGKSQTKNILMNHNN